MDFVLVPGAWMGEWVWEPVTLGLRTLGHRAHPVTLSGLAGDEVEIGDIGLAAHVEDVLAVLQERDLRDVIVVGHSYSGIVAGQVADRAPDRVSHTVYVDAFLPVDGRSLLDAFAEEVRAEEVAQIAATGGRWPAPTVDEVAGERDLTFEQARSLAGRLVGHPGRTVTEPAVLNRPLAGQWATYVSCAFEFPDDAAALLEEPTWTVRKMDAGHWPMVSAPGALVRLLAEIASEHG